jgi:hypothetical protein
LVISTIIATAFIVIFNQNLSFFFGTDIGKIDGNVLGILSIIYTIVIGLLFFLLQNNTNTKIQESIDSSNKFSKEISQIVKKSDELIKDVHSYESKRELINLNKNSIRIKLFLDIQDTLVLHYETFKINISNFKQNEYNQARYVPNFNSCIMDEIIANCDYD